MARIELGFHLYFMFHQSVVTNKQQMPKTQLYPKTVWFQVCPSKQHVRSKKKKTRNASSRGGNKQSKCKGEKYSSKRKWKLLFEM